MKKKIEITLILLVIVLSAEAQNTVIKAGHLFDAKTGKMLDNQTIIIQNGKVKESISQQHHGN